MASEDVFHCGANLEFLPDIDIFRNGSLSDDETDLSSPSSCGTPTDGLDSFIFDIPELILPSSTSSLNSQCSTFNAKHYIPTESEAINYIEEKSFHQTLRKHSIPDQMKDEKYWKRRLRNNRSAKKSREAKRVKDDFLKSRMAFLEMENKRLKMLVGTLLAEKQNQGQNAIPWPCWHSNMAL
ncbi:nuclear factor interleukin-3-regulated protein [Exaiptasia diaphana]|uniref:BZIP domain-containing protein n=1 Tax=Exaiptasia diaphana TaxID=2652724 RepID=A0A913XYE8_EXADI|nr:nuclear factor interleukin-3-regulated protein [Exaiptasia diaphana]KXJ24141.1 D site-binding protein [Exaiptasia diaphana]